MFLDYDNELKDDQTKVEMATAILAAPENINLTQEMVHSLNKKSNGGNVLIKPYMSKAYDRVDWCFLLHVLDTFGFSPQVYDLIKACISLSWYSIMMNDTPMVFALLVYHYARGSFSSAQSLL